MTAPTVAPGELVRAFVDGTPAADGPVRFVAATEGRKVDGYDWRMAGADLARYHANPVVLWNHDVGRPPVGRGAAEIVGPRLMIDVTFDRADPFAAEVEAKYRRGFLNAVSARAIPTVAPRRGVLERWELVEVSTVSVPIDADAVASRRAMAQLGRELLELAGPDPGTDRDADVLAGILSTLDERAALDKLDALRRGLARPHPAAPPSDLEARLRRAVRAALTS